MRERGSAELFLISRKPVTKVSEIKLGYFNKSFSTLAAFKRLKLKVDGEERRKRKHQKKMYI